MPSKIYRDIVELQQNVVPIFLGKGKSHLINLRELSNDVQIKTYNNNKTGAFTVEVLSARYSEFVNVKNAIDKHYINSINKLSYIQKKKKENKKIQQQLIDNKKKKELQKKIESEINTHNMANIINSIKPNINDELDSLDSGNNTENITQCQNQVNNGKNPFAGLEIF